MGKNTGVIIGGAAVAILALWLLPFWLFVVLLIGIPVGAYFMLDSSQRRRLREIRRRRRQIGP